MNICYQADADLDQKIVKAVVRREPQIDFQTAFDAGLEGMKDLDVLALAARQYRILVSHDRKTMPDAFAQFITTNRSTGVLIVSRNLPLGTIIEELILIWSASSPSEWFDRIVQLPL